MSSTHGYDREGFLAEFFPDAADRAEVEAGSQALINVSRAHRLAEMRKRLGLTQAEVAERMNVRQERVSAIERAKIDTSELRTLAAYILALGGLRRRTTRSRLTSCPADRSEPLSACPDLQQMATAASGVHTTFRLRGGRSLLTGLTKAY
jgi:DNA-binding XRE family transcriptional regulator